MLFSCIAYVRLLESNFVLILIPGLITRCLSIHSWLHFDNFALHVAKSTSLRWRGIASSRRDVDIEWTTLSAREAIEIQRVVAPRTYTIAYVCLDFIDVKTRVRRKNPIWIPYLVFVIVTTRTQRDVLQYPAACHNDTYLHHFQLYYSVILSKLILLRCVLDQSSVLHAACKELRDKCGRTHRNVIILPLFSVYSFLSYAVKERAVVKIISVSLARLQGALIWLWSDWKPSDRLHFFFILERRHITGSFSFIVISH